MVAPARERGLKFQRVYNIIDRSGVAPARERGLKSVVPHLMPGSGSVAPARERGLKFAGTFATMPFHGRSREGAWIEML